MIYEDEQEAHTNPFLVSSLWADWVRVVCGWQNIPKPTEAEWVELKKNFHHDKAPLDSVEELKQLRGQPT